MPYWYLWQESVSWGNRQGETRDVRSEWYIILSRYQPLSSSYYTRRGLDFFLLVFSCFFFIFTLVFYMMEFWLHWNIDADIRGRTWVNDYLNVFQGEVCGRNLVPFQSRDILSEFIQFLSVGNMRLLEGTFQHPSLMDLRIYILLEEMVS